MYNRTAYKNILLSAFNSEKFNGLNEEEQGNLVVKIEKDIYNKSISSIIKQNKVPTWSNPEFIANYSIENYRIYNIIQSNQDKIIDLVLKDNVNITLMSNYDLIEDKKFREEYDYIILRKNEKIEAKISKEYICVKCGFNESIQNQYVGACVDEPTKLSYKCIRCGYTKR